MCEKSNTYLLHVLGMRVLFVLAALVGLSAACCYTLQSNPRAAQVPVYTWYLDTMSRTAVRPTDCVGQLRPVDQQRAAALSACELLGVEYRPMDLPEVGWRAANITDVTQVLFSQPCVGFGPYRAGDRASSLLLHQLSGSWVRMHLQCDDSRYGSCVQFGLQLRQAAVSRVEVHERDDPNLGSCVRTPSQTPSRSATPSTTPQPTPTPSQTSLPAYGAVYRVEATFDGSIFIAMQFGLNYQQLHESAGATGSHWCSVPVLDEARTHVMATLFPELPDAKQRSVVQWAHAQLNAQSAVQVTVLWQTGGWCRVTLDGRGELTFDGCRLFLGDRVYETTKWVHVEPLDPRAVPVCGTVVAASLAEPTPEPRPVVCSPQQGWRVDAAHALVRMRSATEYAEARVALEACSDGSERPRLDAVSALMVNDADGRREVPCRVDPDTDRTHAYCGDRLLLAIAGTGCESVQAPGFETVARCGDLREAVLLV